MKAFSIIKVGYSAGVYGNTGEYFQAIIVKDYETGEYEISGLPFVGQYGAEHRVAEALKAKGYTEKHIKSGGFGRLTGEAKKYAVSEYSAIEEINKEY